MNAPDLLAVQVMKTAGTSLRGMLVDGLGDGAVYPNQDDLDALPKRWYPGPAAMLDHVRARRTHGARLLIGHVPYVLADALPRRPRTILLLRDPVARAVSMLEHRRRRTRRLRGVPLAELLDDETFVAAQIRDYQAKILAFDHVDECPDHVNVPLDVDGPRLDRALQRLEQVDVLGTVEDLPGFRRRLEAVTGIRPGPEQQANRGDYDRDALAPALHARLEELTQADAVVYERARELTAARRGRWWPRRTPRSRRS